MTNLTVQQRLQARLLRSLVFHFVWLAAFSRIKDLYLENSPCISSIPGFASTTITCLQEEKQSYLTLTKINKSLTSQEKMEV
ncbi:hypothetical protein C0J52_19442 [Blattella germanica]|nr:hypothetical protein C0J52_19442 [Blattella germanica]